MWYAAAKGFSLVIKPAQRWQSKKPGDTHKNMSTKQTTKQPTKSVALPSTIHIHFHGEPSKEVLQSVLPRASVNVASVNAAADVARIVSHDVAKKVDAEITRGQIKTGYIFDIDGVLSDHSHRIRFIKGIDNPYQSSLNRLLVKKWESEQMASGYRRGLDRLWRNWKAYFAEMHADSPIRHNIELLKALYRSHKIVLITGRPEAYREVTEKWLARYNVPYDVLVMRPEKNFKKNAELKSYLYYDTTDVPSIKYLGAFDDNPEAIDVYNRIGIPTFQVPSIQ